MLLDSREGVVKLIKSLERKLTTERLARYWTGFHGMPFALYDANNVFLDAHPNPPDGFAAEDGIFVGERTRDFVGNTVIELNGGVHCPLGYINGFFSDLRGETLLIDCSRNVSWLPA